MKNRYITKLLCITMAATMLMANTSFILAEDSGDAEDFAVFDVQEAEPAPEVPEIEIPAPLPETPVPQPEVQEEVPKPEEQVPENTPEPEVTAPPEATAAPEVTAPPEEKTESEETDEPVEKPPVESASPIPEETPTPEPDDSSSVEESEQKPDETLDSEEKPEETATPEPTATPIPGAEKTEEWIVEFMEQIEALGRVEIFSMEKHGAEIKKIREVYNALTEVDKSRVKNYPLFVAVEERYNQEIQIRLAESYPMNLHMGAPFDVSSLSEIYHLSFSEDFASVMGQIESEYLKQNEIENGENSNSVTTSANSFLVRNWQDITAVYIYEQHKEGEESFRLDANCKEKLAEIFAKMNPILTDKNDSQKKAYGNYHIDRYIQENNLSEEEEKFLKKYTETNCKLLCATATSAKGYVRQSVGDHIAEERVDMLAAGFSLLGRVRYFWGGKSTVIGMDSSWGTPMMVTAPGSRTTGTQRYYGLDCSGFVTWTAVNAYKSAGMEGVIGVGTSDQWYTSYAIEEAQAQPGDLVFQRGPEAGSNNHVGIICGKTDNGDWLVVHCNARYNTVSVDEAYSAGFRYIRRPSFYPDQETVDRMFLEIQIDPIEEEILDEIAIDSVVEGTEQENTSVENPELEDEVPESDESQETEKAPVKEKQETEEISGIEEEKSEDISETENVPEMEEEKSEDISETENVPEMEEEKSEDISETEEKQETEDVSEMEEEQGSEELPKTEEKQETEAVPEMKEEQDSVSTPEFFEDIFVFEDLSTMNSTEEETAYAPEIQMELKEEVEEYDFTTVFAAVDETVTAEAEQFTFDLCYDFDSDEFRPKDMIQDEIDFADLRMLIDSSSEFFVGPLMPVEIPTFGPEFSKESIFYGPELPAEIRIEEAEAMLAEEYEVK